MSVAPVASPGAADHGRRHGSRMFSGHRVFAGVIKGGRLLLAVPLALLVISAVLLGQFALLGQSARAENADVSIRRDAERTGFSNDEIVDGFFKIAFGAELQVAGREKLIRKFDQPIRVFFDNRAQANRRADLAAVIADIRGHVAHLDVTMTDDREAANVVVTLVRDRNELRRTIRSRYGRERADQIEQNLTPQCLSGFSEDAEHRILRSEVILTAEGGDFGFLDCAYEEVLQALGPINDDRSVPWTMFNDEVHMGFFDVYDQYLLNILYDPRVRPGMTPTDVKAILPEVLATVRSWVSEANAGSGVEARSRRASASNTDSGR